MTDQTSTASVSELTDVMVACELADHRYVALKFWGAHLKGLILGEQPEPGEEEELHDYRVGLAEAEVEQAAAAWRPAARAALALEASSLEEGIDMLRGDLHVLDATAPVFLIEHHQARLAEIAVCLAWLDRLDLEAVTGNNTCGIPPEVIA